MPKLSISEWTGDYLDEYNRRMLTGHISTTRLSSCSERNGKNDNSVRRMLTEELNRDRRSISYVTDKRLTHRRPNTNDILHVSVFRWEGIYYSTVYVAEMDNWRMPDDERCELYLRLDREYKRDPYSPLHHDNRCHIHSKGRTNV